MQPAGGAANAVGLWEYQPNMRGLYAARQVTNASLQSDDVLYVTMHAGLGPSPSVGNWIEAGWANQYNGGPFAFAASSSAFRDLRPDYNISPGMTVYFTIINRSFGVSIWDAYIWWNGIWNWIFETSGNEISTDENVVLEMFSTSNTHNVVLPVTYTFDTQLEQCTNFYCQWITWGSGIPTAGIYMDGPYNLSVVNPYWYWYGYGGP